MNFSKLSTLDIEIIWKWILLPIVNSESLIAHVNAFSPSLLSSLSSEDIQDELECYNNYIYLIYNGPDHSINTLKFAHRVYFTIPLNLKFNRPSSEDQMFSRLRIKSEYSDSLMDPKLIFSPIEDDYFLEKFLLLDKQLIKFAEDNGNTMKFYFHIPYQKSKVVHGGRGLQYGFLSHIVNPCLQYLKGIMKNVYFDELRYDPTTNLMYATDMWLRTADDTVTNNIKIEGDTMNDETMMMVEIKEGFLFQFINSDGSLDKENTWFKTIIKEVLSYMMRGGKDFCLLSDLEHTIFLKSNNGAAEIAGDHPKEVPIHLQYRVITTHDTGITLQAVFASLLYYEYYIHSLDEKKDLKEEYETKRKKLSQQKHQVDCLKQLMISNQRYIEYRTQASIEALQAIKTLALKPPSGRSFGFDYGGHYNFRDVDFNKLDQIVTIETKGAELQVIRKGIDDLSQVYRFKYHLLAECFDERVKNPPKPDQDVVLKVYDFRMIESHMLKYLSDFEMCALNDAFWLDDIFELVYRLFLTEVACYKRVSNYNKKGFGQKIKCPILYDYGLVHSKEYGELKYCGLYIMMEYIETENFKSVKLVSEDIEDLARQVETLGNIGVVHRDLKMKNLVYNNGFNIIDFSHSYIRGKTVDNKEDKDFVKNMDARTLVEGEHSED